MSRPLPRPTAETREFWNGCAKGELYYQRCNDCDHVQIIPRSLCEHCHGSTLQWNQSKAQGTILSFTEVFRAPVPAFKEMVPYFILLVDMDEGFRLMVNVRHPNAETVRIGQRVKIVFSEGNSTVLPEAILLP